MRFFERLRRRLRQSRSVEYPRDFSAADRALCEFVKPFTMTTPERIVSLAQATRYVVEAGVPGAIVECGVYAGGSMMTVARTLLELDVDDRELWLYDTFEGMPAPSEHDLKYTGEPARRRFELARSEGIGSDWCNASIGWVRQNMALTGYPDEHLRYVKGLVEQTIPGDAPESIALLRLDTDFYESTLHELEHLFPRLVSGGVLIIDDYGDWKGARRAVDEWTATLERPLLLNRIDPTGRIAVKP